jgi:hypothetical protein
MKKEDAVESLERAGHTINDLYTRAWATALYPTQHGWGASLGCIAAIPILSTASVGHMVSAAVVQQLPSELFDTLSSFGKPDKPKE